MLFTFPVSNINDIYRHKNGKCVGSDSDFVNKSVRMTFCVFDVITLNYISCLLIDLHLDEQIHFCNVVVGQLQLKKQQKENANVNEIEIEIYV